MRPLPPRVIATSLLSAIITVAAGCSNDGDRDQELLSNDSNSASRPQDSPAEADGSTSTSPAPPVATRRPPAESLALKDLTLVDSRVLKENVMKFPKPEDPTSECTTKLDLPAATEGEYVLYFGCRSDDSLVYSRARILPPNSDLQDILLAFLHGPNDDEEQAGFVGPVEEDVEVPSFEIDLIRNVVVINFTGNPPPPSNLLFPVGRRGIWDNLLEATDADGVSILVRGVPLCRESGSCP